MEIAVRAELPASKRSALLSLASLFDCKKFLPTVSDVRHFLELRAQRSGVVRQRQDAFRTVLMVLSTLADEELERLINSSNYAGPTQLGPLSDAIRAAGEAMRSANIQRNDRDLAQPIVGDSKLVFISDEPDGVEKETPE